MPRFEVVWPKGIGYRTEPLFEARAEDRVPAKRGEVVVGEVSDGWLLTDEGLFLPVESPDGKPLLKKLANFIPWQGGGSDDDQVDVFVGGAAKSCMPGRGRGDALPPRPPSGGGGMNELDALHQKYDKKYGRPRGPVTPSSNSASMPNSAATSHERHTAYMHEFRAGLEEMGMDTRDDPYLNTYAPKPGSSGKAIGARRSNSTTAISGGQRSDRVMDRDRIENSSSRPGSRGSAVGSRSGVRSSSSGAGRRGGGEPLALCGAMLVTRSEKSGAGNNWREGPANALMQVQTWTSVKHGREVQNSCSSGRVIDVSDRNVMCMSVLGDRAVLGCADHGLKEVDIRAGQVLRNLYTKRYGHTEWVTTVSHCPDGRIISGGMDSKLCLWNASGVVCVDLKGHLGSISRVRTHAHKNFAISSAYDRTLRCWDLRSKTEAACCTGHDAPILEFIWADDVVASGDRSGVVRIWDAIRAESLGKLTGHKGHITAMLALPQSCSSSSDPTTSTGPSSIIASGAQDGHIRIWDLRQRINTFNMGAHIGGAINDIGVTLGSSPPLMVSVGADGRLLVLEPRMNFEPLFEYTGITEDFIYSLLVLDDIAFTGDGRGRVKCFDVRAGEERYVLDAGQNGIRCLGASERHLICAGDDGNAIMFDF